MSPSAVKTLVLASAVVLLSSLSDSVEARNESVQTKIKIKIKSEKSWEKQCWSCDELTFDAAKTRFVCYHELHDHVNWFEHQFGGENKTTCNCCKGSPKNQDWRPYFIEKEIDSKDKTVCFTSDYRVTGRLEPFRANRPDAKAWYNSLNSRCDA